MKIRSGFVSNSSSSSFTCDVCGETQSGMDMGAREAGMVECRNGHTFCETHEVGNVPSINFMREELKKIEKKLTWKKPEELAADIAKIDTIPEAELLETFEELNREECFPHSCPICQLVTLSDCDVVQWALAKNGFKSVKDLATEVKKEFGTYDAFRTWCQENRPK